MTRRATFDLVVGLAVLVGAWAWVAAPSAQGSNPLVGVWEATEETTPDGGTMLSNVGGIAIYTAGGHYAWMRAYGTRPTYPSQAEATDAQRLAAFNTFSANGGTYTVSGSMVTHHPSVAKNPFVSAPGAGAPQTFQIQGKTLTMTNQQGRIRKFTRGE